MRSTCRRSNRKSHRNRRLTRRQKGGLVPNATAPKSNHYYFTNRGVHNIERELFTGIKEDRIRELRNLGEKKIVDHMLHPNTPNQVV
jgi:hypothetical protein